MKLQCRWTTQVILLFAGLPSCLAAVVRARPSFLTPHVAANDHLLWSLANSSTIAAGRTQGGTGQNLAHAVALDAKAQAADVAATYNKETPLALGITVEQVMAGIFVCMIASVPLVLALLEAKPTKTDMVQSALMLTWLISCLYLFTHVVHFRSVHFVGERPLTLVETIYLMSQVLTTVGHGDINPANAHARIVVGLYVLFTILLIADLVSAVVHLAIAHTNEYTKKLTQYSQEHLEHVASRAHPSKDGGANLTDVLRRHDAPLPWARLFAALGNFLLLVTVGVLFYHYYPGENKSWVDGIYMSVITLSTVGFGAVLPATEAGKVFGAFWMLFGVVSLLSLVSGLTELMLAVKAREKWTSEDASMELDLLRKQALANSCSGELRVSRSQFLRFALVHSNMMDRAQLEKIDCTFEAFGPDKDDSIPLEAIERAASLGRQDVAKPPPKN